MSDGALSQEEIDALLSGRSCDDLDIQAQIDEVRHEIEVIKLREFALQVKEKQLLEKQRQSKLGRIKCEGKDWICYEKGKI